MSIPRPEQAEVMPVPTTSLSDPNGTEQIVALVREFYAQSKGSRVLPEMDSGGREPSLSGGFPHATTQAHPPVHSTAVDSTLPPARRAECPESGAPDPGEVDTYAFGEPKCPQGRSRAVHKGTAPAGGGGRQLKDHEAGFEPSLGLSDAGSETQSTRAFYFLPHPQIDLSKSSEGSDNGWSRLEVETIRRDFPALDQKVNGHPLVWLDNAATTHKPRSVIDATSRFYSRDNSNIHRAAHTLAGRATTLFEAGRDRVREFLGAADSKEIVFGRGTTELINLVAQSFGRKNIGAKDEILVSELEHHANIVPWQLLAEQTGAVLRVIPIDDRGELILEEYVRLLSDRTKIVSVAHVSNALGTVNPVEEIVALAHARGVPVLVDGAQSTPHMPVNVQALDVDFYVFSGHKVFGPTGIGALYGKARHLADMPPWQGGGHMIREVTFERTVYQQPPEKFEAGTPDIAGVVGLGAAIEYLFKTGIPAIAAYEHGLLEYATAALQSVRGLRLIGTARNKASVLSFVIPGIENTRVARHLDSRGIAVRAGHHCAQPALRHFGLSGTVRPSLAFYNSHDDVDSLIRALHELTSKR